MTHPISTPDVSNRGNDEGLDADNDNHDINDMELKNKNNSEILLDVGGIKFKTTSLTLSRHTNSVLHKMFDGRFSLKPNKDGYFFIDRDGTHFHYILNYLRDGTLTLPQNDKQYVIHALLAECNFYQLPSLRKQLLFARLDTKILKASNMKQISEWIHEEYPNKDTFDWCLLPSTNGMYQPNDLFGIDRLLFVFVAHNMRFGFYLHDMYGQFLPDPCTYEDHDESDESQVMTWMDTDEELELLNQQMEDLDDDPLILQHNVMESVSDTYKKGFIFWLDHMHQPSNKNTDTWYYQTKYKCYYQGITIDHEGKTIPKSINVIFSVDGMKQKISTDLKHVKGVREYGICTPQNFYEYGKDFYQKKHKIQRIEVFHLESQSL
eukprot:87303_1